MPSRTLVIALAALTTLSQLSLAVTPTPKPPPAAPDCAPKPDHSNYGLHGKSWCPWDSGNHWWKPQGVGCTKDSACQKEGTRCVFPHTGADDHGSRYADALLDVGYGYCDYTDPKNHTAGTECMCGAGVPQPHPGGSFNPPEHYKQYCIQIFARNNYKPVTVVAGCKVDEEDDVQCLFKCDEGSNACIAGADPNYVHKLFKDLASCPGFDGH